MMHTKKCGCGIHFLGRKDDDKCAACAIYGSTTPPTPCCKSNFTTNLLDEELVLRCWACKTGFFVEDVLAYQLGCAVVDAANEHTDTEALGLRVKVMAARYVTARDERKQAKNYDD